MSRVPLSLLTFGALAMLAGVVAGVTPLGGGPEPRPEQGVGTVPGSTPAPAGDGPPMDRGGGEPPTDPVSSQATTPTPATVPTRVDTVQITPTPPVPVPRSAPDPTPTVGIPAVEVSRPGFRP